MEAVKTADNHNVVNSFSRPPWKGLFLWVLLTWACVCRGIELPPGFLDQQVGTNWSGAPGMVFAPNGHMFVWESGGKVWIVEDGVREAEPFLDISEEVGIWRDHGMLGFALHPNFLENGYCYLFYVVDRHYLTKFGTPDYNDWQNEFLEATIARITRYTARAEDGFHSVDPNSRLVLLGRGAGDGPAILHITHGAGALVFGADGSLLASCGDGAGTTYVDAGSSPETYFEQGLADGIIRTNENIGSFRAQLVNSLSSKILRIDPNTGDGLPSNPFYDPLAPRSARSRVWALGLRNPFKMSLRPGTGSHHVEDGNPGVLYVSDVGYATWEEINVCDRPGMNFGWPIYEGFEKNFSYVDTHLLNPEAPNPLAGAMGCTTPLFRFEDLLLEDSLDSPLWPNPCQPAEQIPASAPRFVHTRPLLDYRHGAAITRTGTYSGNQAVFFGLNEAGSPVSGTPFAGNCAIGGGWYTNNVFPVEFQNTYFFADYVEGWIKSVRVDTNNKPVAVRTLATKAGSVVAMLPDPATGDLYYMPWNGALHRIRYDPGGNKPPKAVISADRQYGPSPLLVQFSSTGSADPDGVLLSYQWDFGDGEAASTDPHPAHIFTASSGLPTSYQVSLVVTDSELASATNHFLVSANNTPPQVTILSPADGTRYPLSQETVYDCTAMVTDAEHGANELSCAWQTVLHHNTHTHPEPIDTNCATTTVISPVGCGDETYYFRLLLTVTDTGGLSTTAEAYLLPDCAEAPVRILTAPEGGTAAAGAEAELRVRALGATPLFYWWRKDGMDLPGQTNQTIRFPVLQLDDSGDYTVVVSNRLGSVTSSPPASLIVSNVAPAGVTNILIASNAVWRFLDDGSNLGDGWTGLGFDDTGWLAGPAQLGYGDGNEATVVGYGGVETNRYITTYFRHRFSVADPAVYRSLEYQVLRDDGIVAYLNGTEILRDNLPAGPVAFTELALVELSETTESIWLHGQAGAGLLMQGDNVLAAEIHQALPTSGDISFALELRGGAEPFVPALRARLQDEFILFEWAENAGHYQLLSTGDLTPPVAWTEVGAEPTLSDGVWHLLLLLEADSVRFYSLR